MKTGSIPCKADPVAQKEFLENTIEPVISAAKRGEVELYYVDAAHFVMRAFLGYLWSKDEFLFVHRAIASVTMFLVRIMRFMEQWSP